MKSSPMTPADFRDRRAKAWQRAWAGVTGSNTASPCKPAQPPARFEDRADVLDGLQRLIDWYNAGGVSGTALSFACESLLQHAGRPQNPACATCQGRGKMRNDTLILNADCPEGCAVPRAPRAV